MPNTARIDETATGLVTRRDALRRMVNGAAVTAGWITASSVSADEPNRTARTPGAAMSAYGSPARFEARVVRTRIRSQPGTTGAGASGTPLEHLRGTITPNGLHFERHHAGIPTLDPDKHKLLITGAVRHPVSFDLERLERYPMITRSLFIECSGNSASMLAAKALPWGCGDLHGLLSCSEWTGVPLALLIKEAGVEPGVSWVIAEGADAARMNRSIPLAKSLDDAMIALYQNGERIRPENGYPMRLLLPGYEGNMSIKWLHRLEVSPTPAMSREETSKYSDLGDDGRARLFTFEMGVKSLITSPSPGHRLGEAGIYQVSGLAWSGTGTVSKVEVSVNGGKNWLEAEFDTPPQPQGLSRFSIGLRWQGNGGSQEAMLLSRATDSTGAVQPTRDDWIKANGSRSFYHYNAVQAWRIATDGSVHNVYL